MIPRSCSVLSVHPMRSISTRSQVRDRSPVVQHRVFTTKVASTTRPSPVYSIPQRCFFNPFAPASSTSKDAQTTKTADGRIQHRVSRVVPYPAELMCELSADVARYKEFLPFCENSYVKEATAQFVKDIASHPHPIPNSLHKGKLSGAVQMFEADLAIGFKAFSLTYSSLVTVQHPHRVLSEALPDSGRCIDVLLFPRASRTEPSTLHPLTPTCAT